MGICFSCCKSEERKLIKQIEKFHINHKKHETEIDNIVENIEIVIEINESKKLEYIEFVEKKNDCEKLMDVKDISRKNFKPYVFDKKYVRVIDVYDGDTITIIYCKDGTIYRDKIRLNGIDAPEKRTKDLVEKKYAEMSKKYLEDRIYGKIIELRNVVPNEKYGRILCDVYYNDVNICEEMVEKRLAVKYSGKTKDKVDWDKYFKTGKI